MLGAADADLLFGAVDAVAAGDARAALLAAARLAESGRDVGRFFGDLEAHARGADGRADARRGAAPSCRSRRSRTSGWPSRRAASARPTVVRLLDLIAVALRAMKDGADARTQLELALVKAAAPELRPVGARRCCRAIERLEAAARRGRAAGRARARGARDRRGPRRAARRPPAAPAPEGDAARRRRRPARGLRRPPAAAPAADPSRRRRPRSRRPRRARPLATEAARARRRRGRGRRAGRAALRADRGRGRARPGRRSPSCGRPCSSRSAGASGRCWPTRSRSRAPVRARRTASSRSRWAESAGLSSARPRTRPTAS